MNTYLYFGKKKGNFALDVCDKKAVVNCSPNSSLSMPLFILCAIDVHRPVKFGKAAYDRELLAAKVTAYLAKALAQALCWQSRGHLISFVLVMALPGPKEQRKK